MSQERRDTLTSAGIGTDTPPAGPLGAADETQSTEHMDEECTSLSCVSVTCMCAVVSVLCYIYVLCFYMGHFTPMFDCSLCCVLALSAVLTQHSDFEIYGSAGVSGARAVCERGPCVFITLSCRISPNT